jgi:hypothetical protein
MWRLAWLLVASAVAAQPSTFNAELFEAMPYARQLMLETRCLPAACNSTTLVRPRNVLMGLPQRELPGLRGKSQADSATAESCANMGGFCYHGANMLPYLIERYSARRLAELGVCTGISTAAVVARFGLKGVATGPIDRYYLVDPWGGNKCKPGCACTKHIQQLARTWPSVLTPLRGYSVPMAVRVPNASLDLNGQRSD